MSSTAKNEKTTAATVNGVAGVSGTIYASEIAALDQAVTLTELWAVQGRKVRLTIRSDFYKKQCFARAQVWSGNNWNEIATIQAGAMDTENALYMHHNGKVNAAAFDEDRATLLAQVEWILEQEAQQL